MTFRTTVFIVTSTLLLLSGIANSATHKVYIFLSETCPLSQYYTRTLKDLHKEYDSEKVDIIGIFPNSLSTSETIETFKQKYSLPFTCIRDSSHTYVYHPSSITTVLLVIAKAKLVQCRLPTTAKSPLMPQ